MALISLSGQGSYATFSSRSVSWSREVKLKPFVTFQNVGRLNGSASLKSRFCISKRAPVILRKEVKHLRISCFKGSSQNGESGRRSSGSKVSKNPVKLSDVPLPHKGEETMIESPLSLSSGEGEKITGSPAIHKLFKKWLVMLRTQSPNSNTTDAFLEDGSPNSETSKSEVGIQGQEKDRILKAAWRYFLRLDATIKIPLVIFIPLYLAINAVYGAEVSKELNPLWVIGPLIVALYIKMIQGLCALYVFTFKQTIKIAKNLPSYFLIAYSYVAQGKLKEDIRSRFWQPIIDMKNLDYKELSRRKLKELEEWVVEKYLDYIESIWPLYCRTIRFLKKAHLI